MFDAGEISMVEVTDGDPGMADEEMVSLKGNSRCHGVLHRQYGKPIWGPQYLVVCGVWWIDAFQKNLKPSVLSPQRSRSTWTLQCLIDNYNRQDIKDIYNQNEIIMKRHH